jgi:type IV secretion system protein TrbL
MAGTPANAAATGAADGPPAWATAMKRRQAMTQGANMASHTLKGGDSHGGGSGPDISDKS